MNEYLKSNSFEFDRKKYSTTFGKGQNQNDVIITYVEHSIVVSSDFFLAFTMKALELR